MAYPAKAVANFFLELAWERGDIIDPMKMQKLIYFAHGWFLAKFDQELINEEIEVWDYGPVISSIYQEFKKYGLHPITEPILVRDESLSSRKNIFNPVGNNYYKPNIIRDSIEGKFLTKMYNYYGKYDSVYLSKLTHAEGSPWLASKLRREAIIPNELIKSYFSQFDKSKKVNSEV